MATEILPEVTAAQAAERAAKEQERLERARALAVRVLCSALVARTCRPWLLPVSPQLPIGRRVP